MGRKHIKHVLASRRYSLLFVLFLIISAFVLAVSGVLNTGYFITGTISVVFISYLCFLKFCRNSSKKQLKKKISEILKDPNGIIATSLFVFGIATIAYKLVLMHMHPLLGTLAYLIILSGAFIWFSFYMYRITKDLSRVIILLVLAIITMLIMFSVVYSTPLDSGSYFALKDGAKMSLERFDAIYFSTVTFTTLGYGDITPVGHYRIFAVFEALMGYICVGLFVGALGLYFSYRSHHRHRR